MAYGRETISFEVAMQRDVYATKLHLFSGLHCIVYKIMYISIITSLSSLTGTHLLCYSASISLSGCTYSSWYARTLSYIALVAPVLSESIRIH